MTESKELTTFTNNEVDLIKSTICKDATDEELKLFLYQAKTTGLNPLARQIYAVKRWDGQQKKMVMGIQVSIDGFRLVAERTGDYTGQVGPFWCGEDGVWKDVWLSEKPPAASKVGVWRKNFQEPCWGVARFAAYAQTKKEGGLNSMWAKMGDIMIAKCFDDKTEVLTDSGFRKFSEVGDSSIMMVDGDNVVPVRAVPFKHNFSGKMVTYESDDINFSVTPNHDMITSYGKVEAGAMYLTSHQRGPWKIPRIVKSVHIDDEPVFSLAGYILADGYIRNKNKWAVSVSKPKKIRKLRELGLHEQEMIVHSAGQVAVASSGRKIKSNFDKIMFVYDCYDFSAIVGKDKQVLRDFIISCSPEQAKAIVDAWQDFDGYTNKKTGVRRVYITNKGRIDSFEMLAVKAGYSVSTRKERTSDIGKVNTYITISERNEIPIFRQENSNKPSLKLVDNKSGVVWCVTVPSGKIIVRRDGFSMICGNCAEALALRKAFPQELSGLYTNDEMSQANQENETSNATPVQKERAKPGTMSRAIKPDTKETNPEFVDENGEVTTLTSPPPQSLVYASEEQLATLYEWIDTLNISKEVQSKWLQKAGVTAFRDMDEDKVVKLITMLKAQEN